MKMEVPLEQTENATNQLNKKGLGWKAKRLIDAGRIQFLEQNGYQTFFVSYVDESITPENCLLIALPNT